MALSIRLPMASCLALSCRIFQRASFGTQKTRSAKYTSRSSGSSSPSFSTRSRTCSNMSEIYFRKISPSTTDLYSAASRCPRSLSAACQSSFSMPSVAPLPFFAFALPFFFGGIVLVPVPVCGLFHQGYSIITNCDNPLQKMTAYCKTVYTMTLNCEICITLGLAISLHSLFIESLGAALAVRK